MQSDVEIKFSVRACGVNFGTTWTGQTGLELQAMLQLSSLEVSQKHQQQQSKPQLLAKLDLHDSVLLEEFFA